MLIYVGLVLKIKCRKMQIYVYRDLIALVTVHLLRSHLDGIFIYFNDEI